MTKKKIYLRLLGIPSFTGLEETIDIFEGDIKSDIKYWKDYHNAKVIRYFELKEIK